VLEVMDRIFGRHSVLLNTADDLTGKFNDHLEHVSFIGLNEPAYAGDHQQAAKFRSMITEKS
jgi:hypothetical protein